MDLALWIEKKSKKKDFDHRHENISYIRRNLNFRPLDKVVLPFRCVIVPFWFGSAFLYINGMLTEADGDIWVITFDF